MTHKNLLGICFLLLSACAAPLPTPTPNQNIFGRLEVEFSSGSNAPKARFYNTGLGAASLTLRPESEFVLTPPSTVLTLDTAGTRTLSATFGLRLNTFSGYTNIVLVAYNQASNNIGGTAVKNINTFGGNASAADAQSIRPAHGTNGSVLVDPFRADLVVFTPAEANQLTQDARATNLIGASDTALEYGYVARVGPATHIRAIGPTNTTGQVTIAVRLPTSADQNLASGAPYRFVMTFLLATQSINAVTQSLEEQSNNALLSRASAVSASAQVRVLRGSSYQPSGSLTKQLVCGVRTSVVASSSAYLTAPAFRFLGASMAANGAITANFDTPIDSSTFVNGLAIHGSRSGKRTNAASYSTSGNSVTFTPSTALEQFAVGEEVLLSVTNALRSSQGGQFCETTPVTKQFKVGSSRKPLGFRRPVKIAMNSVTGGVRYSNLADLNNDGRADLITASASENKLFTRLGTGVDLTYFGAMQSTNLTAGLNPNDLDFGDLNGDGNLDVVVNGTNAANILLGNGTGGFSSPTSLSHAVNALVALGEVNGDGKPDLVTVAFPGADKIDIISRPNTTVNGSNTVSFGAATNNQIVFGTSFAVVEIQNAELIDVTGDNLAELVIGSVRQSLLGSNPFTQLTEYLVNQSGVFGTRVTIAGRIYPNVFPTLGYTPCNLTTGDINPNTGVDFGLTCESQNSSLQVDGLALGRAVSPLFSFSQSQFADLDNDGIKEWITVGKGNSSTTLGTSSLEVRYSSRAGTAGLLQHTYMVPGFLDINGNNANSNLFGVGIADLNGDGLPEIVAGDDTSGAQVWRAEPTGSFRTDTLPGNNTPEASTIADFNRDGLPDVAATSRANSAVILYSGNSTGFATEQLIAAGGSQFSIASGDVNNDGRPDMIAGTNKVAVLLSSSTGGFNAGSTPNETLGTIVQALAITDLNADGNLDIVSGRANTGQLQTMFGDGTGTFTVQQTLPITGVTSLSVADLNSDGFMDVVVLNNNTLGNIFFGSSNGTLQNQALLSGGGSVITALTIADVNADGTPDLIYAVGSSVVYRLGVGDGTFGNATTINNAFQSISATSLATGDFNVDGVVDLIATTGSSARVFNGLSTGGFAAFGTDTAVGTAPQGLLTADIDGNGLLDALTVNRTGDSLSLLIRF